MKIIVLDSGIAFRNPKPHVCSRHAYFPSVVRLRSGELLASIVIGEAFESENLETYISRSTDSGQSWSEPTSLISVGKHQHISVLSRLMLLPNDELVANVLLCRRERYLGEGLTNPLNAGFVPTELAMTKSSDHGRTWSDLIKITSPIDGPSFEMCSPIVEISDGRWLWPTSTWKGWDGYCPNGMKMIALVSYDKGNTWPAYVDVMKDPHMKRIFWEGKIIELKDGSLLSVAWVYDQINNKNLPNHFSVSSDKGKTWTAPKSTGIKGETMAVQQLPDGKICCIYRRSDLVGLWCNVCEIRENNDWVVLMDYCLWGATQQLNESNKNIVEVFNELKFGAPCITSFPDGSLMITFWCYENMVSNIRWIKINFE